MWWRLTLVSLLATSTDAFAVAPIRWAGLPARNLLLAPEGSALPNMFEVSPHKLTILDQPSGMPSNLLPMFTATLDNTITWRETDWCIEADGTNSGATVYLDRCTGRPNQRWNWLPVSRGQNNHIQLQGTNQCLDVNDKEGSMTAFVIELRECGKKASEAWAFGEVIPLPAQDSPQHSFIFSSVRHILMSTSVLVLSFSALLWLVQRTSRSRITEGGQFLSMDHGGLSLTLPMVMQPSDVPDSVTRISPAAMALTPISLENDASRDQDLVADVPPVIANLAKHSIELRVPVASEVKYRVTAMKQANREHVVEKANWELALSETADEQNQATEMLVIEKIGMGNSDPIAYFEKLGPRMEWLIFKENGASSPVLAVMVLAPFSIDEGDADICTGRRVAVVGGGPAGLAASRFLVDYGHTPSVFESGSEVGGIWAPQPTNHVLYPGLVTNIPTVCMQSFDLDFVAGSTSFINCLEYSQYFRHYSEHFNLRQFFRFGSRVTKVIPTKSEEEEASGSSSWNVTWTDSDGSVMSEEFDAVVVATGHYETPYLPEIPGQDAWLAASDHRRIMHAVDYVGPADFVGKAVLVIGGRSSAADIAREVSKEASWLYVLSKKCKEIYTVGTCTHVPFGSGLTEDGHLHIDGDIVDGVPVDVVILATGYTYEFPFLDEGSLGLEFGQVRRYVAPLYQHILHVRRPSLCFVGLPLSVPSPLPLFEAQSCLAAAHLRQGWTSTQQRQDWVQRRFATVGERSQDLHFLGPIAWEYMRELMREAGMTDEDFDVYSRRVAVIQTVHQDRGEKQPKLLWDDDWYRRCEYSVDYKTGLVDVTLPQGTTSTRAAPIMMGGFGVKAEKPAKKKKKAKITKQRIRPPQVPSDDELREMHMTSIRRAIELNAPSLVDQLATKGFAVVDNFLPSDTIRTMRDECEGLRRGGNLSANKSTRWDQASGEVVTYEKRNVLSTSLEGGDSYALSPRLHEYCVALVSGLPPFINEKFARAQISTRAHANTLAVCLGDGSEYAKHYDNLGGDDTRKLTVLIYFNEEWREDNGGCFRMFVPDGTDMTVSSPMSGMRTGRAEDLGPLHSQDEDASDAEAAATAAAKESAMGTSHSCVDIAPLGGRLLAFWSDTMIHGVLPSQAFSEAEYRWALTVWMFSEDITAIEFDPVAEARHWSELNGGHPALAG